MIPLSGAPGGLPIWASFLPFASALLPLYRVVVAKCSHGKYSHGKFGELYLEERRTLPVQGDVPSFRHLAASEGGGAAYCSEPEGWLGSDRCVATSAEGGWLRGGSVWGGGWGCGVQGGVGGRGKRSPLRWSYLEPVQFA